MTTAPPGGGLSIQTLASRERAVLLIAIGATAALAWSALLLGGSLHDAGHGAVTAPHARTIDLGVWVNATLMWFVMMVAMMLPPVLPWLMLVGTLGRSKGSRMDSRVAVGGFAAGYFSVWLAYSVAGASLQVWLQGKMLLGHDLRVGALAGGVVLLAAGVYQITPFKTACLRHCRNPMSFLLAKWRDGPSGALNMGLRHGAFCVACCWALMAISFTLGLMNLLWMAALTVLLCIEKIAPGGFFLSRLFGAVFGLWGLWLVVASTTG
ncbi:MAG: DUF2182 domain-containing protein [Acidobacteriota bacterium]|nr:DUF2182 domain-containing protein [Acidobacteriota bacterium]